MPALGVSALFVLGHLIVNNDVYLHFPLYYHDVVVVMSCNFPSCLLYVSHARIDPVGSHAPHHLVSKLAFSPPPPLLSAQRRSLSPYRAGTGESVTCATQVDTQEDEE